MRDRVIVALDLPGARAALGMVDRLGPACTFYKVGLELYTAAGPAVVAALRDRGKDVFLDLKLHDIPNTVASAVRRAGALGVRFLTLHALGGRAMLQAAADAAATAGPGRSARNDANAGAGSVPAAAADSSSGPRAPALQLLGVTVLTSLDAPALAEVLGRAEADPALEVERLAAMARTAGLAGVVASAAEAAPLRSLLGPESAIVTPGIRLPGQTSQDQRRVRTAGQAFGAGASHIVVGRPVTSAPDPAAAFEQILDDARAR